MNINENFETREYPAMPKMIGRLDREDPLSSCGWPCLKTCGLRRSRWPRRASLTR